MEVSLTTKILMGTLTLLLMVGMGSTLTKEAFRSIARHPRAVLVGLASQYGWMPALAALALHLHPMPPGDALGLLIMACMAGGNASNMLTYLARADLALSLSMTAASSIVSIVALPILLAVYVPLVDIGGPAAEFVVPFGGVALTLAIMLVPVPIGMWIRQRRPTVAARLERLGTLSALLLVVAIVVQSASDHVHSLATASPSMLGACLSLVSAGIGMGYATSRVARLPAPQRRAVSLETGVQNMPMALAVITAAFPAEQAATMVRMPTMYATVALLVGGMVTVCFRWTGGEARPPPSGS